MDKSAMETVYYLPGAGGQLATGLGQALLDRSFDVTGRETRGTFRSLPLRSKCSVFRKTCRPTSGMNRLR